MLPFHKKVTHYYFLAKKLQIVTLRSWQQQLGNRTNFFFIFLTCSGRREEGYPYKAFIKQNWKGYKAFSYTTLKRVPVSDIGYKMFLKRYRYNPTV